MLEALYQVLAMVWIPQLRSKAPHLFRFANVTPVKNVWEEYYEEINSKTSRR